MPANYFDERIAKSYEARWPELFEPAAVDDIGMTIGDFATTSWDRAPFTNDSTMHVSVWETASPRPSWASVRMGRDDPTREAM